MFGFSFTDKSMETSKWKDVSLFLWSHCWFVVRLDFGHIANLWYCWNWVPFVVSYTLYPWIIGLIPFISPHEYDSSWLKWPSIIHVIHPFFCKYHISDEMFCSWSCHLVVGIYQTSPHPSFGYLITIWCLCFYWVIWLVAVLLTRVQSTWSQGCFPLWCLLFLMHWRVCSK